MFIGDMIPQILETGDVIYPQSHLKWAQLTAHHASFIWQPLAVFLCIIHSIAAAWFTASNQYGSVAF